MNRLAEILRRGLAENVRFGFQAMREHKLRSGLTILGIVVGVATVIAMVSEIVHMWELQRVSLTDLLMLFLYLEVFAMVGLYYGTGKLPVRFPLYIGMVALARYLILDMKEMDGWRIFAVTAAVLMLAIAVLVVRYGDSRFPYPGSNKDGLPLPDSEHK